MIHALGALLLGGSSGAFAKKSVQIIGRKRAIVYFYLVLVSLLFAGAAVFGIEFAVPEQLLADYIALVTIGAVGVIGYFKAMEHGKISVLAPLGKLHVLIVIALSIFIFNEPLTAMQIGGAIIIVLAATVIALNRVTPEKGANYMLVAILGWGYYFTFLKTFVDAVGPYQTTLIAETGVAAIVIAYYLAKKTDLSVPAWKDNLYSLAQGSAMFFGLILYNFSISTIGAALTASVMAGAPIVTAVLSYFMLGEKLDLHKYAAIILMIIGLIMI
ncbi:EamA family transporter [Candidatus Micrarchaeota archaeon]|nr:EamA family transporter [Candidatus Micrarchaeota archaeon]